MVVDGECTVVVNNLQRAHQKWARLNRVLSREDVDARTLGRMHWEVVQLVMLYVSETWLMTTLIGNILGGFYHKVACSLMGRQPLRGRYGIWVYPPLEDAMAETGFQEVDTNFYPHKNTVSNFIATRKFMHLCLEAEQRPGSRVTKRWWEQDRVNCDVLARCD